MSNQKNWLTKKFHFVKTSLHPGEEPGMWHCIDHEH